MPELRDITVHVTDQDGGVLKEWGTQTMRRRNQATSYIRAETDMTFRVSVQPKIPYVARDVAAAHDYHTRSRGDNRPGRFIMEDEFEDDEGNVRAGPSAGLRRSRRARSALEGTPRIKREGSEPPATLSSSRDKHIPPPNFHFLASLFLDGREKAERKVVVYLDPNDEDFSHPDGRVYLKTRWAESTSGDLVERGWVFKDVGIETMFDKLLISGQRRAGETVQKRDEDFLIDAMSVTDIGDEPEQRPQSSEAGKIVVTIQRIKLGEKWNDAHYHAKHREGEDDDVDMEGATKDVTHTAGFSAARRLGMKTVRVVAYSPYQGEGNFAKFTFFYRSEEKLRRFNFDGFPNAPPVQQHPARHPRNRRQLNLEMAKKTPLSISKPASSPPKTSNGALVRKTFEEKVKAGDFEEDKVRYGWSDFRGDPEHDAEIKEEPKSPILDPGVPLLGRRADSPKTRSRRSASATPSSRSPNDRVSISKADKSGTSRRPKPLDSAASDGDGDGKLHKGLELQHDRGYEASSDIWGSDDEDVGESDEVEIEDDVDEAVGGVHFMSDDGEYDPDLLSALDNVTLGKRGRGSDDEGDDGTRERPADEPLHVSGQIPPQHEPRRKPEAGLEGTSADGGHAAMSTSASGILIEARGALKENIEPSPMMDLTSTAQSLTASPSKTRGAKRVKKGENQGEAILDSTGRLGL
ncbi:MAG: hypothetical protein M1832_005919 [Thelocarpon impressellum]|nr:MAG: hypothetical protein M1832_005919 [Thelocarpon impressellum]